MKCIILLFIALSTIMACKDGAPATAAHTYPKPGTIVARAEMPVTGDSLNNFNFTLKVIADSNVTGGVYDIDADFGPNYAGGQFTLPKGGTYFTPAIRKSNIANAFIIGFKVPGDTTFYDYYEVACNKDQTSMRYIKAYSFE